MPTFNFKRDQHALRRSLLPLVLVTCLVGRAQAQTAVWTAQYDQGRTAANLGETILNTSNVNTSQFGLLFTRAVDGLIYAQPLYVPSVTIKGVSSNVVYVATMNNSVYAFDADKAANSTPLWHVNLGPALNTADGNTYIGPQIGILSTPVIDVATKTMYVVSLTVVNGNSVYSLHALDITSGSEKFKGPVAIQGSVPGTAIDSRNGILTFSPANVLQRPALALFESAVVIGFGAFSEGYLFHGWLMSYNASTLTQTGIVCTTPDGTRGGLWMSGRGIASDIHGMYFMVGNGTTGGSDLSSTFVRLGGSSFDAFIPSNYKSLDKYDWDLNAGGPLLLPNTNLILGAGKTGTIFLLDRTNLGGLVPGNTQVVQSWQATKGCADVAGEGCDEIHHYAYWYLAPGQPRLYLWALNETLKAYAFNGSTFDTTPVAKTSVVANFPGGQLAISADGGTTGTGIVWAAMSVQDASVGPVPGILRAFDAVSLTELWNSNMKSADNAGLLAKFCLPTIANGKVYLATFSNQLNVYGLE